MVLLKTFLFLIVVPGTVIGWVPWLLARWGFLADGFQLGAWRYVGLLPLIAGVGVLIGSAVEFAVKGQGTPAPIDPPKLFVATGLYRFVRNPMYVGVLWALLGEFFLYQQIILLAYALAVWGAFCAFVMLYEEPTLRIQFGATYIRYCQSVPRWLPRLRPFEE